MGLEQVVAFGAGWHGRAVSPCTAAAGALAWGQRMFTGSAAAGCVNCGNSFDLSDLSVAHPLKRKMSAIVSDWPSHWQD